MKLTTITLALSLALATNGHALAADKKDEKKDKTIAELIKDKTEFAGIFSLYQDEKTGDHLMVIDESQLDTPFVYFTSLMKVVLLQKLLIQTSVKRY